MKKEVSTPINFPDNQFTTKMKTHFQWISNLCRQTQHPWSPTIRMWRLRLPWWSQGWARQPIWPIIKMVGSRAWRLPAPKVNQTDLSYRNRNNRPQATMTAVAVAEAWQVARWASLRRRMRERAHRRQPPPLSSETITMGRSRRSSTRSSKSMTREWALSSRQSFKTCWTAWTWSWPIQIWISCNRASASSLKVCTTCAMRPSFASCTSIIMRIAGCSISPRMTNSRLKI